MSHKSFLQRLLFVGCAGFLAMMLLPSQLVFADALQVSKIDDTNDGVCDADCSLREAIDAANATPGADTINVPAGIYTLSLGNLPTITTDMDIAGAGANVTNVSGANLYRPFTLTDGVTVTLSGMKISDGSAGTGGGIYGAGTLTLNSVWIADNTATNDGAGIWMNGGKVIIRDSAVSGNSTGTDGIAGGIALPTTTIAYIINTTITGNTAALFGGGVTNSGTAYIINSTVAQNSAGIQGSSLYNSSIMFVQNTVVTTSAVSSCMGTMNDRGHNIDNGTTCHFNGSSLSSTDPKLDVLANNGGSTPTMALLLSSPAINNGINNRAVDQNNVTLANDQRGAGFARIQNTTVDVGAFETTLGTLGVQLVLEGHTAPNPDPSRVVNTHVIVTPQGGGTVLLDQTFVTNQSSAFTLPNIPVGTYLFSFKGSHTLARQYVVTINAGANSQMTDILLEGDADNNNGVTIADFAVLATSFGKGQGQPGYDDRADFNDDTTVTITDFSLLAANFGKTGDGGLTP